MPQLPPNQQLKKLGELCDILDSRRKPISQKDRITGQYPYYGATGVVDYVADFIFDEKLILIGEDGAKRGSGDQTAFSVEGKVRVNNHAHVIRPYRDLILDKYLINFLNFSDLGDYITGTTVPKLNQERLRQILIPLPPLVTQYKIVAKLDEISINIQDSKSKITHEINQLDELWTSSLSKVFDDEKGDGVKLSDIFDVRDGTHDSPKFHDTGYPLITSKNLKEDGLETINVKYISEEDYHAINLRSKVDKGDLLFAMIGTIGNPTIIKEEPSFAIKNVALFKPKSSQGNMNYLRYFLLAQKTINKMTNESKGATQKFVGLGYLRNFQILLPDLETQKSIVAHLDKLSQTISHIKAEFQSQLAYHDELWASILDQAFKGELVKE